MIGVLFGNFCSSCFIKISVSFYVEIIIFPVIFDVEQTHPLRSYAPHRIRTCGFPASGSLRNESFTLSFVYIDIYPGSYQWIAVIQHIQKFYPIIAFLLASPVQTIEQASHDVISECRYTFCIVRNSIIMVITSQYLVKFCNNLF